MIEFSTTDLVKRLTATRKRKTWLMPIEKIGTNSYADGGCHEVFSVYNRHTGVRFTPPTGHYPWTTPNDYTLEQGDVVIRTDRLHIARTIPMIYCRPDEVDATKQWLGVIG